MRNRLRAAAGLLAAALAAACTATPPASQPNRPPGPPEPPGDARVLWQYAGPGWLPDPGRAPAPLWITDTLLVHELGDGLTAHDLRTGAVRWTMPMGDSHRICSVSPGAREDMGVILFGSRTGRGCDRLRAVDVLTGKNLWTVSVPLSRVGRTDGAWVSDDTVVVQIGAAFQMRSRADGALVSQSVVPGCALYGQVVSAAQTLLTARCGNPGIVAVDTRTGKELWRHIVSTQLLDRPDYRIVSADPPVYLRTFRGRPEKSTVVVLGDAGLPRTTVPYLQPDGELQPDRAIVVGGKTIYVPVFRDEILHLTAIDVATGTRRWTSPGSVDVALVQAEPGRVVALAGSRFVTFAESDGRQQNGGLVPPEVVLSSPDANGPDPREPRVTTVGTVRVVTYSRAYGDEPDFVVVG
jgi:outer membrane protein assembly factor BamB